MAKSTINLVVVKIAKIADIPEGLWIPAKAGMTAGVLMTACAGMRAGVLMTWVQYIIE